MPPLEPASPTPASEIAGPMTAREEAEAWLRLTLAMLVPVLLLLVGRSLTR